MQVSESAANAHLVASNGRLDIPTKMLDAFDVCNKGNAKNSASDH